MSRASCFVLLTLVLGSSGCGAPPELKEFTSADGKFKILMPGTPKEMSQNVQGVTIKIFGVENRNSAHMVSVNDFPGAKGEPDAMVQDRLNGAVQGAVGNIKATLTKKSDITLDGKYPGREFTADLPGNKGQARGRMYLVNGRFYQILLIGTASTLNSEDATRYFNSFALLP